MGNLTSTLTIILKDDGLAAKAKADAEALRRLGMSGADLKKLAGANPTIGKLTKHLDGLQGQLGKVTAFKEAGQGLKTLHGGLRQTRAEIERTAALVKKRQGTLDYFAKVKESDPRRHAKWVTDGLVKQVEQNFKDARKAASAAARALPGAEAAFERQKAVVRGLRTELVGADAPLNKLAGAEGTLKAKIDATNAALQREIALLGQVEAKARAAAGRAEALGRANAGLARGMGGAGRAQLASIEGGRRVAEGMSAPARGAASAAFIARARAAEAHAELAAHRREARREALGTIAAGAGVYAGHKAASTGRASVLAVAEYDHAVRAQQAFTDISEKDQAAILTPQALRIGQETKFTNTDVVKAQTAAMQGLPSGFDSRLRAEVSAGIVENVRSFAILMETDLKEASETIRAYLQASGKDISTKQKALAESNKAINQIVKMAKLGGMSGEDAAQFVKYGAASSTSAGIDTDAMLALGALARRGGLRGDEAGVAMRSMASKIVAPTADGVAALNAAGIKHSDYVRMPDSLSTDALEGQFRLKMGKSFTPEVRSKLDKINADKALIADREKYVAAVTEATSPILGKTRNGTVRASDSAKAAKAIGGFHKLSGQQVDAEGLLDAAFRAGMTLPQLNAWLTDKHGGKAAITQRQWEEYHAARAEIRKAGDDPNYAKDRADKVMAGIYGSFENLKGSVENLYLAIGKANEGLLKLAFDTTGKTLDQFSKMPQGAQQATSIGAGLLAGAAALRGAYVLTKNLLGFGSSAALTASAGALSGSAAALTAAAARLGAAGATGSVGKATGGVVGAAPAPAGGARAGSLLATTGVVGGVAAGGVAASIIANEVTKDRDFAQPYLDNPMLGADPAGYGFAAGILHAQPHTPNDAASFGQFLKRSMPSIFGHRDGSLPPGAAGMPQPAPARLPGLDGRPKPGVGAQPRAGADLSLGAIGGLPALSVPPPAPAKAPGGSFVPQASPLRDLANETGGATIGSAEIQSAKAALAGYRAELAGVQAQLNGLRASGEGAFSLEFSGLEAKKAQLEASIGGVEATLQRLNSLTIAPSFDLSGAQGAVQQINGVQQAAASAAGTAVSIPVSVPGADAAIAKLDQVVAAAARANAASATVGGGSGAVRGRSGSSPSFSDATTPGNGAE